MMDRHRAQGHEIETHRHFVWQHLFASIVLAKEFAMPTITVRNVPVKVVQSLKALARRHNRSMEREVRDLIEGYVVERRAVLDQIEAGWNKQTRRPTATEIDTWMGVGRP